jgi:hypothetical protein
MNLQDAIQKAGQILDQERVQPTVSYEMPQTPPAIAGILTPIALASERGLRARSVRENPEMYQFKRTNYDLLCAILDQLPEREKPALFSWLQKSLSASSFRHKFADVQGAGSWPRCSSELPLVAEFLVRRGNKKLFVTALGKASPSPGLTLLLKQIAEMIALNFTLFTDEEYTLLPTATESIRQASSHPQKRPKPISTLNSNTVFHVSRELPQVCDAVEEECRKARYLDVRASLLAGGPALDLVDTIKTVGAPLFALFEGRVSRAPTARDCASHAQATRPRNEISPHPTLTCTKPASPNR